MGYRYTGNEEWPRGDDIRSVALSCVMAWRGEQTSGKHAESDDRLIDWIVATFGKEAQE
jgi:hypothetical protein